MKVIFFAHSGDIANAPTHKSDVEEFDDGTTTEELEQIAQDFMWENVRPEFWYEIVEGE